MILIALGANLDSKFGTPEKTLVKACKELERRGVKVLDSSRIWLTSPVPVSDQPCYRNAVIKVQTSVIPAALLKILHEIESDFGRLRREKDEARVLDLDLLVYDDYVISDQNSLIIPHPRMTERGFVLFPMKDVIKADDNWAHPVSKKSIVTLICDLTSSGDEKPLSDNKLFERKGGKNEAA